MATADQRGFRLVAACVAGALALAWAVQARDAAQAGRRPPVAPGALEQDIPAVLGPYTAQTVEVSRGVADTARATDFLFRAYGRPEAPVLWVWISAYANQRDATVHSPVGCYRGMGWSLIEVPPADGAADDPAWPVRWLRVRRGAEERLVLYWYETTTGTVATELQRNLARLWGRLAGDTALVYVRLSTPLGAAPEAARGRLLELARMVRDPVRGHLAEGPRPL